MKKLLIFLGILFLILNSQIANAQTVRVTQTLGSPKTLIYVKGALSIDSAVLLPSRDTMFTPIRQYAMIVQPSDNTPYLWNGTRWVAFSLTGGTYVTSFNERTGDVIPQAGDYSADMIVNAVDVTQTYANPSWITSLAYSKITGAPVQFNPLPAYGIVIGGTYPNNTFRFDSAVVHPVTAIAKVNDTTISFTINNRPPVFLTIPGRGSSGGGGGGGGGVGTVTNFTFVPANGIIGSVSSSTSTPALTLGTTLNGIVYANGTSFLSATIGTGLAFNSGVLTNTITNDNQLANGAGYITNISGLIFPGGGGVSVTGAGTPGNPYIIGFSGSVGGVSGGSSDSLKHLPVDTSAAPRNGSVLAFDSVNHKWYLTPNGSGGGGGGSVTRFNFTNGAGFTGVVTNATTTPTLALTMQNGADDGLTKGIAAYTATDFNVTSGVVAIDYVNGQKATASVPGFLTAADWTTFNNKIGGTLTSGQIYVGNVSNIPTAVAMSGDVNITNAGVTTIQPAVVTYAKIQNITSQRLLGRYAGTNGVAQEISIGSGVLLNSGTGVLTADSSILATKYFVTHLTDTIGVGHLGGGQNGVFASADFDSLYDKTHVGGYGVLISTQTDSSMLFRVDTTSIAYKSWVLSQVTSGFVHGIDDVLGVGQTLTADRFINTSTHAFSVQGGIVGGLNFVMHVTNNNGGTGGGFQSTCDTGYAVYAASNWGDALYGQSASVGVHGYSNGASGVGILGENPNGAAGQFFSYVNTGSVPSLEAYSAAGPALQGIVQALSTNTTISLLQLQRLSNGTVANNVGGSIDILAQTIGGTVSLTNQFISKWTDAATATRTSQLSIVGVNNAAATTLIQFNGNGSAVMSNTLPFGTILSVTNTEPSSNNTAISGTSAIGGGVVGNSTSGTGVNGTSVSGFGGAFSSTSGIALSLVDNSTTNQVMTATLVPASTNTVRTVAVFNRFTSGTAATGIGAEIDLMCQTSTSATAGNYFISTLTDATGAAPISQLTIKGHNASTASSLLYTLDGNGNATNTGGHIEKIVTTSAGTYTILANDYTVVATGTTSTWTFPTATTGRILNLVNNGSGSITYGTAVTTGNGTTTTTSTAGNKDRIQFDGSVWRKIN